jgi:hypothetical protein
MEASVKPKLPVPAAVHKTRRGCGSLDQRSDMQEAVDTPTSFADKTITGGSDLRTDDIATRKCGRRMPRDSRVALRW